MQLTHLKRVRRFRKQEKGATIVLVVVSMVALLGVAAISIDYATGVQKKQTAQNAADAAAMAVGNACALGNTTQCTAAYAVDYAKKNAGSDAVVTVTPATPVTGAGTVTVQVKTKAKTGFAGAAFGKNSTTSAASATATWNGVVTSQIPDIPLGFDYCQWKIAGNLGAEATYEFGVIPTTLLGLGNSPNSNCKDPQDGANLTKGPYSSLAVVMTNAKWFPTWDEANCKVPASGKISVWQNLGSQVIGAAFSTGAACRTKFASIKPGQTILVPLLQNRLKCTVSLFGACLTYATDYIKVVGFVPFRVSTGAPFYHANKWSGDTGYTANAWNTSCHLSTVGSLLSLIDYGCQKVKGSFVKTTEIFPDVTYGTVTGTDPVKAALSLKLTK